MVEVAQAQAGVAEAQAQVRGAEGCEECQQQAAVVANPLAVYAFDWHGALPLTGMGVCAQPGQARPRLFRSKAIWFFRWI